MSKHRQGNDRFNTYYPRPSLPEKALLINSSCSDYKSVVENERPLICRVTYNHCSAFRARKYWVAFVSQNDLLFRFSVFAVTGRSHNWQTRAFQLAAQLTLTVGVSPEGRVRVQLQLLRGTSYSEDCVIKFTEMVLLIIGQHLLQISTQ